MIKKDQKRFSKVIEYILNEMIEEKNLSLIEFFYLLILIFDIKTFKMNNTIRILYGEK